MQRYLLVEASALQIPLILSKILLLCRELIDVLNQKIETRFKEGVGCKVETLEGTCLIHSRCVIFIFQQKCFYQSRSMYFDWDLLEDVVK